MRNMLQLGNFVGYEGQAAFKFPTNTLVFSSVASLKVYNHLLSGFRETFGEVVLFYVDIRFLFSRT